MGQLSIKRLHLATGGCGCACILRAGGAAAVCVRLVLLLLALDSHSELLVQELHSLAVDLVCIAASRAAHWCIINVIAHLKILLIVVFSAI